MPTDSFAHLAMISDIEQGKLNLKGGNYCDFSVGALHNAQG